MINTVRNTVMAIINKDNNGYITPDEFNLFAKQAQLEIFEQYFYDYTNWVNKRNARLANDGYSDIQKQISENLDTSLFKRLLRIILVPGLLLHLMMLTLLTFYFTITKRLSTWLTRKL